MEQPLLRSDERFAGLDLLKAIAILLVVFVHDNDIFIDFLSKADVWTVTNYGLYSLIALCVPILFLVNGALVMNQWNDQASTFGCPSGATAVGFTAGETKSIVIEYYERKGGATAQVRVTPPGGSPMPIPESWLSPELNVLGPN